MAYRIGAFPFAFRLTNKIAKYIKNDALRISRSMQYGLQCLLGPVHWITYVHVHINPAPLHFPIVIWRCNGGRQSMCLIDGPH